MLWIKTVQNIPEAWKGDDDNAPTLLQLWPAQSYSDFSLSLYDSEHNPKTHLTKQDPEEESSKSPLDGLVLPATDAVLHIKFKSSVSGDWNAGFPEL